jgi:hypothetical protein
VAAARLGQALIGPEGAAFIGVQSCAHPHPYAFNSLRGSSPRAGNAKTGEHVVTKSPITGMR